MKIDLQDSKKRLLAAQNLLLEDATSFEKFRSVKELVQGVHPKLDSFFEHCDRELTTAEEILGRDFVSLGTQNLPERTEEQRKRKKAILFLWHTWNEFRGEVTRVQKEMNAANSSQDQVVKSGHIARIFNFAKGPFGVITVVAVALAAAASASAYTSVKITIHNKNCPTMIPSSSIPNFIPGIYFPNTPIHSGESEAAMIPALPMSADGGIPGKLTISSWKFTMTFDLGDIQDITFDDKDLMNHITDLTLSKYKMHDLVFVCK